MIRTFFAIAFLSCASGCSTLMSKPEPRAMWPDLEYTSCTESKVAPTLDAIGGGWEVGAGIVHLALGNPVAIIDLLLGSLLIWSSAEGSSNADDCKALRNHLATSKAESRSTRGNHEELELDRQKIEFEKMKLELEREKLKLELEKAREKSGR